MYFLALFSIAIVLVSCVTAQSEEKCPALFLRYSSLHSFCKPANPQCNILKSFVTQKDINVILREHNNLRSRVAIGKEQKLPTAGNMLQMVWDDELAAVAQKHANQCLFEHDCSNCRRVQNFGVGQNLATEEITNSPSVPEPNWPSAIKSWYDEITYFQKTYIDPFVSPPPEPTYGHFSQLVWAESWRIGCGYVLYQQQPNQYKKLYVCNYGPAGNIVEKSMYKAGQPCSICPVNSCCDKTCGTNADYPGLCKITDNRAPMYKPQKKYIFYCDFQNQPDCQSVATGQNKWLVYNTLSGSYLGIVLKGGEESAMTFTNKIKPTTSSFCFTLLFRKGPNKAGEEENNRAVETFIIPMNNFEVKQELPNFGEKLRQQFSQFNMALSWNMETQFKLAFSVPAGKPEQFFEVQKIYATEGLCTK